MGRVRAAGWRVRSTASDGGGVRFANHPPRVLHHKLPVLVDGRRLLHRDVRQSAVTDQSKLQLVCRVVGAATSVLSTSAHGSSLMVEGGHTLRCRGRAPLTRAHTWTRARSTIAARPR